MWNEEQSKRLVAEHEVMRSLAKQGSILEFETVGDPPTEYKVKLHGKGITRGSSFGGEVEYGDTHEFEIRLGYSYPDRPPDIRFLTPIFHPNISSSGYVRPEECGLDWAKEMTLDVVCERLWDLVRGAYVDVEKGGNYSAKRWFAEQKKVALPVDNRPLRDRGAPTAANVIRYERGPASGKSASGDVLYIGDETPTPQIPKKRRDEKDVLYIGDE
jgi:ubiquitin-protein ligase